MKSRFTLFLICVVSICLFTSCNYNSASSKSDNSKPIEGTSYTNENSSTTSSTLYFLKPCDQKGKAALLYYRDNNLDMDIVLCNKPDCEHNSEDCSAFFVSDQTSAFLKQTGIYHYNQQLIIYAANRIYSIHPDGTQRKLLYTVSDEYNVGQCAFYQDSLFLVGSRYIEPDSEGQELSTSYDVLRFPINEQELKVLYSSVNEPVGLILGMANGKLLLHHQEMLDQLLPDRNQAAYDEQKNGRNSRLIAVDIDTGSMDILIDKKSGEFDSLRLMGDTLFYHSRKDSKIYSYSVSDGATAAVGENIKGYIEIADLYLDGHLIYYALNTENYFFEPDKQMNETYFLDTASRKSTKISYTRKINKKESNIIFTDVIDDTLYFDHDVEITGDILDSDGNIIGVHARNRQGRIKASDLWNEDYKQVEFMPWNEFDEYNAQ